MKSLAPKVHVHVLPTKNQTSAKEIRDNTSAAIFHLFPPVIFKSWDSVILKIADPYHKKCRD